MTVEFQMWTSYHPPVGFQKRGHNEFYWLSRCGRWHVRKGCFGTMILTDRRGVGDVHVVKGGMPEVQAKIEALLAPPKAAST